MGCTVMEMILFELMQGDCLELMKGIPDGSVDMVLCDLPYGTTDCKWDTMIPFEPLWAQYKRIVKKNGAIVLFGAEPFSSSLRMSALEMFKYDWIWSKSRALGFTNAKNKPMNKHEIASVFSEGTVANKSERRMPYFPQGLTPYGKTVSGIKACKADSADGGHRFARPGHKESFVREFTNYPTQIVEFANDGATVHPTQKPVALCEYLIRTYTNEGERVLDNTMGSGTTGVACMNTNRRFIGVELSEEYFQIAKSRIEKAAGLDLI
jgi:site-specific DNA-methyltransferase (adenine-specific)